MNFDDIKVGMRVCAGRPGTDDYEAGEVLARDGHVDLALVSWDLDKAGSWLSAHALWPEGQHPEPPPAKVLTRAERTRAIKAHCKDVLGYAPKVQGAAGALHDWTTIVTREPIDDIDRDRIEARLVDNELVNVIVDPDLGAGINVSFQVEVRP